LSLSIFSKPPSAGCGLLGVLNGLNTSGEGGMLGASGGMPATKGLFRFLDNSFGLAFCRNNSLG